MTTASLSRVPLVAALVLASLLTTAARVCRQLEAADARPRCVATSAYPAPAAPVAACRAE